LTQKLERLRRFIPLDALHQRSLRILSDAASIERRDCGDAVFAKGDNDGDAVYLLAGEVLLDDGSGRRVRLGAGEPRSRFALANVKPRLFDCRVTSEEAQLVRVDGHLLEKLVTWEHLTSNPDAGASIEVADLGRFDPQELEWVLDLLQTPAFLRLPTASLEAVFQALEPVSAHAGEYLIRAGEPGDYYYLIREGRFEVSRTTERHKVVLAELGPGDAFGEEALISAAPRNADVMALTAGRLARLGKPEFGCLLERPLIRELGLEEAGELMAKGAARIDVRTEEEYRFSGLKSALNMPLYLLRNRMGGLSRGRSYIVYCDTGERSAAAAFLMARRGLDVYVLKGGLTGATAAPA
jgi:rhodanese-related sulfurtransferase